MEERHFMLLTMLKSKVHRVTVIEASLQYVGSLTLDPLLMEAAQMGANERVQELNVNTGSRIETYLIEGERGSGIACLNGPAARSGQVGDIIIALTYCQMTPEEAKAHTPIVVHVDANNHIVEVV